MTREGKKRKDAEKGKLIWDFLVKQRAAWVHFEWKKLKGGVLEAIDSYGLIQFHFTYFNILNWVRRINYEIIPD